MKYSDKVLIEQELYGIKEDNGMIADGTAYILESVADYLETENPGYTLMDTLYESIEYSDTYSCFVPLLEAADAAKDLEAYGEKLKNTRNTKDIAAIEKEGLTNINKVSKWFMNLDPEKQKSAWETVIKILIDIILIALTVMITVCFVKIGIVGSIGLQIVDTAIGFRNCLFLLTLGSVGSVATMTTAAVVCENYRKKKISYNMAMYEENMKKWDKAIDKINDSIETLKKKFESSTDHIQKKEITKLIHSAEKTKKQFERAIKNLIKVKQERQEYDKVRYVS